MTTAYFAPPGERTCRYWDGPTASYCGGTDDVRPFLQGDRCVKHTPTSVPCPFCGSPVPGLLAGCKNPDCRTKELDDDRAYQRAMDI